MRNLKRVLSLTLASVMLMGMMVVGSAAAGYDDVSETDNVEAIEVLQAIEVMVGDERGFGPERPVNRAEMAVVMGKLLSLDYNYYASSCPFTDVYDWAQGWVGACYANKIVSGRGNGIYDPGATVTAVEAASMLMRALGYFRYQNDYGDSFELSTVTQGTKIRIFDGVGSSANEPMTRNQVAQMVLNALQSAVVEPDGNTINLTTPDGAVITGKVNYVSVTSDKSFASAIKRTQATSVGSTNLGTIVELGEQLYQGKLELRDNDNDVFGRPARTWKFDSADIGTYAKKELIVKSYTEKVTGRTVYDLLGQSTIRDNDLESYLNGHETEIGKVQLVRANNNGLYDATTGRGSEPTTGRGVLTEVYLDHDLDKITIVSIDTYLAQVNSDYNANSETVSLSVYDNFSPRTKLVDLEDVPGIVDLKKDDWLLVRWADESYDPINKRIVEIGTPEIISDVKATQFSKSEDEDSGTWNNDPDSTGQHVTEITAGGTTYKNNRKSWYEQGTLYDYQQDYLVNKTYDLYLDYYGNFIGASLHSGADQYVFITGYDRPRSSIGVSTANAAAIFTDGHMDVIKVNVKNTNENIDDYLVDHRTAAYDATNHTPDTPGVTRAQLDARWDDNAYMYWPWSERDTVAGNYNENMWYSYTEVDGVYTLTPVKGWTLDKNSGTDPSEITVNCSNVRLIHTGSGTPGDPNDDHMGTGRSYSEDESVFITVELGDTDAGTDTGVTDVTGIYTGIQNVNLVYETGEWVHSVYDSKNGYIVAAIVLGEAEGVVDNYAFITDGTFNERYDEATKTHYWDFKCILNGERVTKTIKSKFDNTVKKLDLNTVQELVVDAEGYVVNIKDLDDTDPGAGDEVYNNYDYINNTTTSGGVNTINLDDYDVYDIEINSTFPNATNTGVNYQRGDGSCIDLAFQNNTLHYDREAEDVGLHVVKDAKAIVKQYVNNEWTWVSYSSVSQAFNDLTDADNITTNNKTNLKQFNGRIVAVLNSRGEAEWVFFWDYTRANTISNGYSVSFVDETGAALTKVTASASKTTGIAKGETVTFTVAAKEGCKVEQVRIQGGAVLTPDANGVYTLTNINSNRTVEITASGEIPAEKVTITLELGTGVNSIQDQADGKTYVSGKKFTGDQGDAVVIQADKAAGVSTIVVRFYPDDDPTNPVILTDISGDGSDIYILPFNKSGKVTLTQDPADRQFNELKDTIDSMTFDLYTKVVNASHIIYYSNAEADSRDDYWSTRNPYTNKTANGRQVWYNDAVEQSALASFINDKIAETNYGPVAIAVDTTSWSGRVGPTMIGSAEQYTRQVVVYAKKADGTIDTNKAVGRITVKYNINEISNNARTP